MPGFNKVMLIGNLTRDPQTKQLPTGTIVAEFGLATSRRYRAADGEDKEETCFVDCAAFGRQAETINQWCRKGKPIFVEGRLKYDAWEDKQSGAKRNKLSLVVENFQFLGGREQDGAPGERELVGAATSGAGGETKPPREHPGQAGGRQRGRGKAEQPFGQGKIFKEADIPF